MPLVEQELLILPEKMSSSKVLMGFILLDLNFLFLGGGGGEKIPLVMVFLGPVVQKFYWTVSKIS
jgi:hypothetical protein